MAKNQYFLDWLEKHYRAKPLPQKSKRTILRKTAICESSLSIFGRRFSKTYSLHILYNRAHKLRTFFIFRLVKVRVYFRSKVPSMVRNRKFPSSRLSSLKDKFKFNFISYQFKVTNIQIDIKSINLQTKIDTACRKV